MKVMWIYRQLRPGERFKPVRGKPAPIPKPLPFDFKFKQHTMKNGSGARLDAVASTVLGDGENLSPLLLRTSREAQHLVK